MSESKPIHCLFCFGVLPAFFEADVELRREVFVALQSSFDDLEGRFGVRVLGTLDDDQFVVGPTYGWPWTCYILATLTDHPSAARICNILRESTVRDFPLWRFLKIEARMGVPLFFGDR